MVRREVCRPFAAVLDWVRPLSNCPPGLRAFAAASLLTPASTNEGGDSLPTRYIRLQMTCITMEPRSWNYGSRICLRRSGISPCVHWFLPGGNLLMYSQVNVDCTCAANNTRVRYDLLDRRHFGRFQQYPVQGCFVPSATFSILLRLPCTVSRCLCRHRLLQISGTSS